MRTFATRARAAACLLLGWAAAHPAAAQDKPVELRFAHWLPAQHSLARTGFEPWAKSVEAASGGSIKIVFFPAQQLGKAADHYDMARDALEKGVADAITFPWGSIISFNLDKAVKYHLDTRLYAASFVWAMNRGWYDRLSAAQKKVIDGHCTNDWAAKVGAAWGGEEDAGQAKLQAAGGHTVVPLTPAQLDAWKAAVQPVTAQWTQAAQKAGVDGAAVLGELKRELAARNAAY